MTLKKINNGKSKSDKPAIKSNQTEDKVSNRVNNSFWQHKTAEELAKEQGIQPVKDAADFEKRYLGGFEDWDDIDEFLKEVRG
jgi:hypothetical protein